MLILVRPVFSLLVGTSLLLLGSGLLNTLLAVRGSAEGYSDQVMGLIMSGYFAGYFLGTFVALPLIQRVGHVRAFAMFAALGSVSMLMHEMFVSPWAWGALRLVTGMAMFILYTIIESWLNSQTSSESRGQVFAIYMVVNLGSLAAAQQLLKIGPATDYLLFGIAGMLVTLSLVPVTGTRFGPPQLAEVKRLAVKTLWGLAPVAVSGALLSGLAMGAFWGMGAVYASRIGLDVASVAAFVTAGIAGGALLQYPIGRYSDTRDRRKVLLLVAVLAVISALLIIPASFAHHYLLYLAIAIYGGLAFAVYPLSLAHLIDRVQSGDILAGGSALLLLHGVGAALGPALSGQMMSMTQANALPIYFAAMQALLVMLVMWKIYQRKIPENTEEHSAYVPTVRMTPTALEMHSEEYEVETGATDQPGPGRE